MSVNVDGPFAVDGDPLAVIEARRSWSVTHGDALRLLQALPEDSVDALITDPPYSSGGQYRGDRDSGGIRKYLGPFGTAEHAAFDGDNRDQRSYLAWLTLILDAARRATKPGGVACVFADWRQLPITTDALQAGGWTWRGIVPWIKPGCRPQQGRFAAAAEYVVWGSRGALPAGGTCHPGWFKASADRERQHPTQKPGEVMRGLVRIAPSWGIVLDPFAGSGATLAAALAEGRRGIGFESTAEYAAVAARQCRELVG